MEEKCYLTHRDTRWPGYIQCLKVLEHLKNVVDNKIVSPWYQLDDVYGLNLNEKSSLDKIKMSTCLELVTYMRKTNESKKANIYYRKWDGHNCPYYERKNEIIAFRSTIIDDILQVMLI